MDETILVIAGLPGCGKTTYLDQLSKESWRTFDDFKANAYQNSPQFQKSRKYAALQAAIRDNSRCAVADIDFCKPESRAEAQAVLRAEFPSIELGWRFFANDLIACERNIRRRSRASIEADLRKLYEYSAQYTIPEGMVVLPVLWV